MKRSEPLPLLAGRLRVRSVAGAADDPLPYSVMGAPDGRADRSRIYYEAGPSGLAIVATELFQTAGPGFIEHAKKALAAPGTEVVRVRVDDPSLRVIASLPTEVPDGSSGTAFMLVGYVVQTDGTVQRLQIGTFPGEFTSVPGCRALALRLARSLTAGPRQLETKAGRRELTLVGRRFALTVPDRWVLTVQRGPDFDVARVRQLAEFPTPAPLVGLALTHHPDRSAGGPTTQRPAQVLGTATQWKLSTGQTDDGNKVLSAALDVPVDGMTLDVWAVSPSDEIRKRSMAIVESLARIE
ncbi:MAG: hypothetical protein JRI23_24870 [Deltaproteobacteria bacterium]|jgi:hypothetical protein|nr:hypothetical protein [Deltaproteobacteria bacterium]MBW2535246.1 hypothetical protein [Deltaproteobacteria bacterium]